MCNKWCVSSLPLPTSRTASSLSGLDRDPIPSLCQRFQPYFRKHGSSMHSVSLIRITFFSTVFSVFFPITRAAARSCQRAVSAPLQLLDCFFSLFLFYSNLRDGSFCVTLTQQVYYHVLGLWLHAGCRRGH